MLKFTLALVLLATIMASFPEIALAEQRLAWNGKEIKGWICNGRELKPKFGASMSNTWIIDGMKAKPKSGANTHNTWNVGNAPILVIAGALALHLY